MSKGTHKLIATMIMCLAGNLVIALPSGAQNLISDSGFDLMSTAGWSNETSNIGWVSWSSVDFASAVGSGSLWIENHSPVDAGVASSYSSCIDGIQEGEVYEFGTEVSPDSAQLGTGQTYLLINWYSQAGCVSFLDAASSSPVYTDLVDVWQRSRQDNATAPPGAQSAVVRLYTRKVLANDAIRFHYDDIYFGPVGTAADRLFYDGFESGSSSLWSAVTP